MKRRPLPPFFAAALIALWPAPLWAHASEQGFVLLLPTGAYTVAGTLAVVFSLVLVTVLSPRVLAVLFRARRLSFSLNWPAGQMAISILGTVVFLASVYIGLQGPTDPQNNLLPLTLWTVWWVGLFVVQGLVADVWRWINPWTGVHQLLAGGSAPLLLLPERWGAWPAVAVFLMFQGFILADVAPNDPDRLALFALGYWVFTLAGMILCGSERWLAQVECFTVLFALIGRLRPVQAGGQGRYGFAGWRAVAEAPLHPSHAVFCLVILASGSFDGLHETFWWLAQIGINPLAFPGRSAVVMPTLVGLYAANAALIAVFALAVWVGLVAVRRWGGGQAPGFGVAFNSFAIAILPIALGYHFAHYFVTFLVQIQYVAATLADPLARGWNLFGLGAVRVTTGFLNTQDTVRVIWITQAAAVVASHILSVLMTHHLAAGFVQKNRDLIALQIGLSLLMIAYTIFGLWLLASPRGV